MTARIAIGGFLHETHSFAPLRTEYRDFLKPGGFPAMQRGAGMLAALVGILVPSTTLALMASRWGRARRDSHRPGSGPIGCHHSEARRTRGRG